MTFPVASPFFLAAVTPTNGAVAGGAGPAEAASTAGGFGILFWLLVPVAWPLWFDACNVGAIGFALSSVVLAYEVATHDLPANRVASAIAVLNLGGVLAGAALELIPGIVASMVHASPLRTMQAANAVFALTLAGTLAAAWRLPRGARHHSGPPE